MQITVDEAITSRHSCRAYKPDPVPRETIEHILRVASRAPSGSNIQPWKVYVAGGDVRRRVSDAILRHRAEHPGDTREEYHYYPHQWREPYHARRRECGWGLYKLAGIAKGDKAASFEFAGRNFDFWGAPVGMIFTLDRDMEHGAWIDLGLFLQSIMLAARGQGLHTIPQAAFRGWHHVLRPLLGIPDGELVVCGMALGFANEDDPLWNFRTEREPLAAFVRMAGF